MIVTKGILAGGRYPFLSTSISCFLGALFVILYEII